MKREGSKNSFCRGWEARVDKVDETKLQINVTKKYKLDETLFMAEINDLNYIAHGKFCISCISIS